MVHDPTSRRTRILHLEQRAALASLEKLAAGEPDFQAMLDEATRVTARALGVEYCKVLELLPDGQQLLLRAGVGWKQGAVGSATVSAGDFTQAGFTLRRDSSVIVDDVQHTKIFRGPTMLHEHGLTSGLSTVIPGGERPFGVLSIHTIEQRRFTNADAAFLDEVASVLGAAAGRRTTTHRPETKTGG